MRRSYCLYLCPPKHLSFGDEVPTEELQLPRCTVNPKVGSKAPIVLLIAPRQAVQWSDIRFKEVARVPLWMAFKPLLLSRVERRGTSDAVDAIAALDRHTHGVLLRPLKAQAESTFGVLFAGLIHIGQVCDILGGDVLRPDGVDKSVVIHPKQVVVGIAVGVGGICHCLLDVHDILTFCAVG